MSRRIRRALFMRNSSILLPPEKLVGFLAKTMGTASCTAYGQVQVLSIVPLFVHLVQSNYSHVLSLISYSIWLNRVETRSVTWARKRLIFLERNCVHM